MTPELSLGDGDRALPDQVVAGATAAQATLGPKLLAMRELSLGFASPGDAGSSSDASRDRGAKPTDANLAGVAGVANLARQLTAERGFDPTGGTDPGGSSALGVVTMLAGFSGGDLDPVELTEACLARIDEASDSFHATVAGAGDSARAAAERSARRWQQGTARPLEGVPFAVKDIISTAGIVTACGSRLLAGRVPDRDATAVTRLKRAGAILVVKTATPEFAFGDETGPAVVNPWDPARWTGGSSSGSAAALAARLVPLALGTDTGGSIRVPASYCGVSGLKPTFGRVPTAGVAGVSWNLDHTGPMARSVDDLALAFAVMAGVGNGEAAKLGRSAGSAAGVEGLRLGVPDGWLTEGCSEAVLTAWDAALDALVQLGASRVAVQVPHAELAGTLAWLITVVEFAVHHEHRLDRIGDFTPSAGYRLVAGSLAKAGDYLKALRARELIRREIDAVFEQVDVMVTPATPSAAPVPADFFDDGDRLWLDRVARNFLLGNLIGIPALVVPAGFDQGLPVAIQIIGRVGDDAACLQVGAALQRVGDHHLALPPGLY